MTSRPAVSVAVPAYNAEATLRALDEKRCCPGASRADFATRPSAAAPRRRRWPADPEFTDAEGEVVVAACEPPLARASIGFRPFQALFMAKHASIAIDREVAEGFSIRPRAVKEFVSAKGLERNFSFLPFTADTGEIYSALDVVTFPNQGVGLGRPVLEAATYGKPVVASGSRDGAGILLPGRTGLLLDDASPERIASALRELIADPDLRRRLGEEAADHARKRFDPGQNARAVESVYDSLLGIGPEPKTTSTARATPVSA
jgi:Glycosyl transferases group 1